MRLCGISDRSVIMNTADWIVVILLLLWAVAAAISISKQKKKVNAAAVAHTVTADAAKIRHKNSGELQKECVLRHFINI